MVGLGEQEVEREVVVVVVGLEAHLEGLAVPGLLVSV